MLKSAQSTLHGKQLQQHVFQLTQKQSRAKTGYEHMRTNGSELMQDEMFLKPVVMVAGPKEKDGEEEVEEGLVAW